MRWIDTQEELGNAWRTEFEESAGTSCFLKSLNNYPETDKSAVDLFKWFLPVAWRNSSEYGVQGFVHPLTVLTETKADKLRGLCYQRLSYLFQFQNELILFPIGDRNKFSLAIYGPERERFAIQISAIMNLFHPKTIDAVFASDGAGEVEGLKDSKGNWNLNGHKEREILLDAEALATIGKVFGSNPAAPVLPNIHCESLLKILEKFGKAEKRIGDIESLTISRMWDETNARIDGTIREFENHQSRTPKIFGGLILNGPHLFVGNPLFKTPKQICDNHLAWSPIDLEAIPDDFIPRAKYDQACSDEEYVQRQMKCEWDKSKDDTENIGTPFNAHWRVGYRAYVSLDGERTLTSALIPPGVGHIDNIQSIAFEQDKYLISALASFSTIVFDSYIRQLGKPRLHPSVISALPILNYAEYETICNRVLGINCLVRAFEEFWEQHFDDVWLTDSWTQMLPGITHEWFTKLTKKWTRSCGLRGDLIRRQALLEIDVLTAHTMGLSLQDLKTLYRMRFSVMREYDNSTFFDQNGRIVFTTNKGLSEVGLSNKSTATDFKESITYTVNGVSCGEKGLGFEDVKDMKEGYVTKTFPDSTMTDGAPEMRTVKYVAPFFKMDREKDYETAWRVFGERFGWDDIPEETPSKELN